MVTEFAPLTKTAHETSRFLAYYYAAKTEYSRLIAEAGTATQAYLIETMFTFSAVSGEKTIAQWFTYVENTGDGSVNETLGFRFSGKAGALTLAQQELGLAFFYAYLEVYYNYLEVVSYTQSSEFFSGFGNLLILLTGCDSKTLYYLFFEGFWDCDNQDTNINNIYQTGFFVLFDIYTAGLNDSEEAAATASSSYSLPVLGERAENKK